jgi:hypothetical protein
MSFNHTPWGDKKKPMCDTGIQQFNMTRYDVGIQTGVYQGCVVEHGLINCTRNETEPEHIFCGSWKQPAANNYPPARRTVTKPFTGGFLLVQFKIIPDKIREHQLMHVNDWLLWHYTVTDDGLSMDMSSTGRPHNWDCPTCNPSAGSKYLPTCKNFTLADVRAQIDFPQNPTRTQCTSQDTCSLFEKMKTGPGPSPPTPGFPTPSFPTPSFPTPG